eukprot:scaffold4184_cov120-Isochrysis_galbana.AAC.4
MAPFHPIWFPVKPLARHFRSICPYPFPLPEPPSPTPTHAYLSYSSTPPCSLPLVGRSRCDSFTLDEKTPPPV